MEQQYSLMFRDPAQLNPPVQGFPLFGGGKIVPGIAIVPPLNWICYGNNFIEIGLAVYLSLKADRSKTYTKTEVDDVMQAKQSTLSFIYPMNLGSHVAGFPLLEGSHIITG